jgi:predicted GNAT family N-acyltransferase
MEDVSRSDEGFRAGSVGTLLVRKAVQTMWETPEVKQFLATIQIQNVPFFERLGWRCLGRPFQMNEMEHQLMESFLRP